MHTYLHYVLVYMCDHGGWPIYWWHVHMPNTLRLACLSILQNTLWQHNGKRACQFFNYTGKRANDKQNDKHACPSYRTHHDKHNGKRACQFFNHTGKHANDKQNGKRACPSYRTHYDKNNGKRACQFFNHTGKRANEKHNGKRALSTFPSPSLMKQH